MRLATLIISLVLMVALFVQSLIVNVGGAVLDETATEESGAVGVLVALLWLVAAAFVIGLPRVSLVVYALAGLLAFAGTGDFPDLWFWGGVSLALAVMSYFGYREKRKERAPADERSGEAVET